MIFQCAKLQINKSSTKPSFWTKSEECAIILFTNICGNLNVENFSIPKCHVYVLCESNSCYIEKFQISFLTSQGNKKKLTEKNEIQYLFSKCWKISTK